MKKPKGATISYNDITKYIGLIPLNDLTVKDDFVNDRQWGNGKYWIGWRPVPDEATKKISETAQRQWEFVCSSFTQNNIIGSNISRLEGAILGNEPDFDVVSKDAKVTENNAVNPSQTVMPEKTANEKFFDKIDEHIVNWWTQNEVHQTFKDLLRAKASFGKAAIRVYVPDGFLVEKQVEIQKDGKTEIQNVFGLPDNLTFEQVLNYIKVEVIHFGNVIDVKDLDFGNKFSIVKLEADTDDINNTMIDRYAVFYVGTDNRSYFRVVTSTNSANEIACDLAGNNLCLTFGEYKNALVTKSVITLQMSVNHAETGSNHALANINYPEVTFINAAPIQKNDANGNPTDVKVQPKQGLGIVRYLVGLVTETATGQQITTPTIHERNGADPEKFSKEAEIKARHIDSLMGMGFKHLADSEYASGDSKAKSMDDLDILISDFETTMNTIGTKVIENVIRLAFNFTNQTAKNRDFNVIFRVNMSQGKLTNDDKAGMRDECAQGLRSDENYMLHAKVTDNPKLEMQRIASQPKKELTDGNPPTDKPPTKPKTE